MIETSLVVAKEVGIALFPRPGTKAKVVHVDTIAEPLSTPR